MLECLCYLLPPGWDASLSQDIQYKVIEIIAKFRTSKWNVSSSQEIQQEVTKNNYYAPLRMGCCSLLQDTQHEVAKSVVS